MSSNQWPGPTGPQGQPPQGYQQGYPQQGPGYGQPHHGPPQRSNTGLVVALVLVLVLILGGGLVLVLTQKGKTVTIDAQGQVQPQGQQPGQPGQPQEQPEQPSAQPGQSQEQQGQQQGQPPAQPSQNQGGKAPAFPKSFGEFTAQNESGTRVTYATSDFKLFSVSHTAGQTLDKAASAGDFVKVGNWSCVTRSSGVTCAAEVYGGVVLTGSRGKDFSQEDVARIGDEFLAAWK